MRSPARESLAERPRPRRGRRPDAWRRRVARARGRARGDFQLSKSASSSAPRTKSASAGRRSSSESTVRAWWSSSTVASGTSSNASRASSSLVSAGVVAVLWPGSATTRTRSSLEAELANCGASERDVADVRRIEDPAEDPVLPLELLLADLDLRAALDPEPRRASSSSSGWRRRADDAVAAVGAEDPEARPTSRARRVLEELGHRLVGHGLGGSTGQSSKSARFSSSIPAPVAHDVATTPHDALVVELERRDVLERGRSCSARRAAARSSSPAPYAASSRSIVRKRSSRSGSDASRTWTRRRARSRCARNWWPRPGAVGRALDEPRDVGDRELALLRPVHHAEDGLERRERVVGDLRLRVRDAAQERRLAGVREVRRAPRRRRA